MKARFMFFLLLLSALGVQAEITTTTTGYNTTVTCTDTVGIVKLPDWTSNNQHQQSTTSKLTVKVYILRGARVTFNWGVSSESGYDKYTVKRGTATIANAVSGVDSGSYEWMCNKSAQYTFTFSYTKDNMMDGNDDQATCTNFQVDFDAYKGPDGSLPFHPTTIIDGKFGDDVKWYKLKFGTAGNILYMEGDNVLSVTSNQVDSRYYWTFTGNEKDGISIYNMQRGASSPVTIVSRENAQPLTFGGEGTNRFMLGDNGDGYVFYSPTDTDTLAIKYLTSKKQFQTYAPASASTIFTSSLVRFNFEKQEVQNLVPIESIDAYVDEQTNFYEGSYAYIRYNLYPSNTTDQGVTFTLLSAPTGYKASYEQSDKYNLFYVFDCVAGHYVAKLSSDKYPEICDTVEFDVRERVYITSIVINEGKNLTLDVGESTRLNYQIIPEDNDGYVYFQSSDKDIASLGYDEETGDRIITGVSKGTCTITAIATDGSGVSSSIQVVVTDSNQPHYKSHSEDFLYLCHEDGQLTAIPQDFIQSSSLNGSTAEVSLVNGEILTYDDVASKTTTAPENIPYLKSYKFNNKFNDQLFSDVIADSLKLISEKPDSITLPVGAIGKRLTASFQTSDDQTLVWVGDSLQDSKHTRQRFAEPVEYRIGRQGWERIELWVDRDGTESTVTLPYGRKLVVCVDWLTDRSTTDYGVPRIDINIGGGAWSSSNYIKSKDVYKEATIKIDGGGAFPSMDETAMQIKGRGNSSWNGSSSHAKNPYHIKFDKKLKPLGMKAGKHWALLSNKQNSSMTTNAIGHRIAQMFDCTAPCHIIPVELYINDSYRGSYNLTERVSIANNSVDLDDDSLAVMVEMDTYTDEAITQPTHYNLCCKLKSPGTKEELPYEETAAKSWSVVMTDFNRITNAVYNGSDVDGFISVDKTANYLAANEFMAQCELKHPKSVFAYTENPTDDTDEWGIDATPWVFGPVWDCDWAYGYEQTGQYFIDYAESDYYDLIKAFYDSYYKVQRNAGTFWKKLRGYESIDRATYLIWNKFMTEGGLDELLEYCDDYYEFANRSFTHNMESEATSDLDYSSYKTITNNAKDWLKTRAHYIYDKLTPYDPTGITDIVADDPDSQNATSSGVLTGTYDLNGRKVSGTLSPGIYIRNGKKIIVR